MSKYEDAVKLKEELEPVIEEIKSGCSYLLLEDKETNEIYIDDRLSVEAQLVMKKAIFDKSFYPVLQKFIIEYAEGKLQQAMAQAKTEAKDILNYLEYGQGRET